MGLSSRDVYLILRAKDEGSRVVRSFSSNLLRAAAQVQAQALRAEAIAKRAEAQRLRASGATKQQVDAVMKHAKALEDEAREVERSSIALRRRVQQLEAGGAALMGIGTAFVLTGLAAGKFFYDSTQDFINYQKQVRLTLTQTDGFKTSMKELSDIGLRVAKSIAVPFEEIQPALYDIFSSTSANTKQAEILLTSFAKAAVAGNTTIQNASRGTIAIMNAFNIPFEKVNDVLDIQFELVRKGVGTYEEFATKLGNAIPSAARAQQSFAMLAAMLAFMTRNGLSAAMASTSAARALEAMSHPKAVANLEKLGIKVRDANGNFRPLNETLKDLRTYLMKFPASDRVAKLVEIFKGAGGTIQARRFLEQVLLRPGELEEFQGYLKDMQTASGEFGKAYDEMASNAASKTQLLTNKWDTFKIKVGETVAPVLLKIVDGLSGLLDKFDKLSPKTQEQIIMFGLFAAVGSVVVGVVLLVIGGLAMLIGAIASGGAELAAIVGILALVVVGVVGLGTAIKTAWDNSANFRKFISDTAEHLKHFRDEMLKTAHKVKESWDKNMKPALDDLWKFFEEKVMPKLNEFKNFVEGEFGQRIIEAFRIIGDMLDWVFKNVGPFIEKMVIPALQKFADWWEKNKDVINPLIQVLAQVVKWILIIVAVLVGVFLVVVGGPIVAIILVLVGAFMLVIESIKQLKAWFKDLWDFLIGTKEKFDKTKDSAMNMATTVMSAIVNIGSNIKDAFKNAGTWLITSGEHIVSGLIKGILNKLGPLGAVMAQLGKTVSDYVPHSPAKKGPLSGKGGMFYAGQKISAMLAAGMLDQIGIVANASDKVVGAVPQSTDANANVGVVGRNAASGQTSDTSGQQPTKTINNYWTINTQEIDPRKHAAELGMLTNARM